MKKLISTFMLTALLVTSVPLQVEAAPKKVKVTYVENGGKTVKDQSVTKNTNPKEPKVTRNGYTFVSWYTDKGLTKKYNPNSKITKNTTLYAKWKSSHTHNYTTPVYKTIPATKEKGHEVFHEEEGHYEAYFLFGNSNKGPEANFILPADGVRIITQDESKYKDENGNYYDTSIDEEWEKAWWARQRDYEEQKQKLVTYTANMHPEIPGWPTKTYYGNDALATASCLASASWTCKEDWVVEKEAYEEWVVDVPAKPASKKLVGYKCSTCGKSK